MSDEVLTRLGALRSRPMFTDAEDLVFSSQTGGALGDRKIRDPFYRALATAGLGHQPEVVEHKRIVLLSVHR
jgi:hypothetical protein